MGIISGSINLGKRFAKGSLEVGKKALMLPVDVMKWTRNRIETAFLESPRVEEGGARADKTILKPTSEAIDDLLGAGPVEEAEGRTLVGTRKKVREVSQMISKHANRIDLTPDEVIVKDEEFLREEHGAAIDKELGLIPEDPSLETRSLLRGITRSINGKRFTGAPFKLLSSQHPLSKLAQKRALFISQNPSEENLPLEKLLMFPPLKKGGPKPEGAEKEEFREIKTGLVSRNFRGKPRFYDLSSEDRKRAVEAPVINPDGRHYSCLLEETDKHFTQRCKDVQQQRRDFVSSPLSLTVKLGEFGYPIGGDPSHLYHLLSLKYKEELSGDYNQLALALHESGDSITVAGFVTKNRPLVPETMPETPLPSRFDEKYWYEQIPQPEREKDSTASKIFQDPHFESGYSALQFSKINSLVKKLGAGNEEALQITGASLERDELIGSTERDTIHISLNINGTPETLVLIKGTRLLVSPEKSQVLASSEEGEAEAEKKQGFILWDDYLNNLETFVQNGGLKKKSTQLLGAPAKAPKNKSGEKGTQPIEYI